jgi:hypothetical protein
MASAQEEPGLRAESVSVSRRTVRAACGASWAARAARRLARATGSEMAGPGPEPEARARGGYPGRRPVRLANRRRRDAARARGAMGGQVKAVTHSCII